jgi:hypothetical protein
MAVTWDTAEQRAETITDSWMDRLGWALLLYATAGETCEAVADVTLGQLRHRVEQPQTHGAEQAHRYPPMLRNQPFIDWLHSQLQAMGTRSGCRRRYRRTGTGSRRVWPHPATRCRTPGRCWLRSTPQTSYNEDGDDLTSIGIYPWSPLLASTVISRRWSVDSGVPGR